MAAPLKLPGRGAQEGADRPDRGAVVCIGFMGAGKSTAARSAAAALGVEAIDVDTVIEERLGKPIHEVFAQDGEGAFRAAEERITLELLSDPSAGVLALGGGTVGHASVRDALADHLVVWLDIALDDAWERCGGSSRPLARDREQFAGLYAEREPLYAGLADAIVPAARSHAMASVLEALEEVPDGTRMLWAAGAAGDYPAYIGAGLVTEHRFWPESVAGRRFAVTDGNVGRRYGDALAPLSGRVAIMPGEQSKTVAHAEIVWTELARAGMTRADVVVALGGGVVGDLAGFCAATYQRGVRYVQVPTTLVAQVDSAYGGKTGVDLAEAKNYVGAYHEPSAVIADTDTLSTLSDAELAAGYAEVVKTALIAGGSLWQRVRSGADPRDPRRDRRVRPHQARDRGARLPRRRPAPGTEPGAHRRSRDRNGHRLRPLPTRRGGGARAAGGAAAVRAGRPALRGPGAVRGSRPADRSGGRRPRRGRDGHRARQEAPGGGAGAVRAARAAGGCEARLRS